MTNIVTPSGTPAVTYIDESTTLDSLTSGVSAVGHTGDPTAPAGSPSIVQYAQTTVVTLLNPHGYFNAFSLPAAPVGSLVELLGAYANTNSSFVYPVSGDTILNVAGPINVSIGQYIRLRRMPDGDWIVT